MYFSLNCKYRLIPFSIDRLYMIPILLIHRKFTVVTFNVLLSAFYMDLDPFFSVNIFVIKRFFF